MQPFRLIAHNGEINTIEGNRAWAITREIALGFKKDELITHEGISDSGNLNGIAEGLRYVSSIPKLAECLAILMPPANQDSRYYKFWSRGMEPWDGPAMVAFSDGKTIGARLDRNGFRPCRWQMTKEFFYLSSEAGVFKTSQNEITKKGALSSGGSVTINVLSGQVSFLDPKDFPENRHASFDPVTIPLPYLPPQECEEKNLLEKQKLFHFTREEIDKIIIPMVCHIKEPLGSMGDTAALPFLSGENRSLFDFFYQDFAQVTNPPLDYIREKIITDMRTFLGRKPNIFEPKEFIPLKPSLELESPLLSLGQMDHLYSLNQNEKFPDLRSRKISLVFSKDCNANEFMERLAEIKEEAINAIKSGYNLLILSHRDANRENLPIPSLLGLTYLNIALNNSGRRLRASLIMEVGDARNSHQIACLLGHGASSVCPYMALITAMESVDEKVSHLFPEEREKNLLKGLHEGVLRIMAKRGISVFRSYQGSKLFTSVGLSQELLDTFFPGKKSVLGGLTLNDILANVKRPYEGDELTSSFFFKEHAAGKSGEAHTMTSRRSRAIHKMLQLEKQDEAYEEFKVFANEYESSSLLIRHLLSPKIIQTESSPHNTEVTKEILSTFGSGAMSFGAISAESQRDLIKAFREIGGRSNSGEGGENPYFEKEGLTSSVKQIASGRFGVTAEYLVTGNEVQIKIAQGAKPGEGGQLMGVKVTEDIAKARFTKPGVDLISPPPQHDIYSIEDLKELIFELKSLKPTLKVSVKLVSGYNIGAIAVGVAKAGADIIQISGGDGGTGAATLLSMKHAGLPFEIGLLEVHKALVMNGIRDQVILRADGGLTTGKDIVIAALLGADEFDFGKLLLIGQGCIMARICEKNTCPTGIATHNEKFKAHYKGNPEKVVKLLRCVARNTEEILSQMGAKSLKDIRGKTHLLEVNKRHTDLIRKRNLDLSGFTSEIIEPTAKGFTTSVKISPLNEKVVKEIHKMTSFEITNTDRAIPATLYGLYASQNRELPESVHLTFSGTAGQGFAVFNVKNVDLHLKGEANDSVAKGMSGGRVIITPFQKTHADFIPHENTIIGNCALYGATGGKLLVNGNAGDRFAVRNSGAVAIVESVGLHACEYMSGGLVWILRCAKENIGAGMSGGRIFLPKTSLQNINQDYVKEMPISKDDLAELSELASWYFETTGSEAVKAYQNHNELKKIFVKVVPAVMS